jgi:hypothetical protein
VLVQPSLQEVSQEAISYTKSFQVCSVRITGKAGVLEGVESRNAIHQPVLNMFGARLEKDYALVAQWIVLASGSLGNDTEIRRSNVETSAADDHEPNP